MKGISEDIEDFIGKWFPYINGLSLLYNVDLDDVVQEARINYWVYKFTGLYDPEISKIQTVVLSKVRNFCRNKRRFFSYNYNVSDGVEIIDFISCKENGFDNVDFQDEVDNLGCVLRQKIELILSGFTIWEVSKIYA